ncbi:MAG: ImmA/IrrE family metallo-endopeptidase [Flavisolibacter sp.]|nr:ImmA/IrrE family metallo-endopeptidase [Flavisolibacter sp.]
MFNIDRNSGAMKARGIIHKYGIRTPNEIDVEGLAALQNVCVREDILEGCEGRLVRKGNCGIITVNKNTREMGRKRFTVAHELGHFELHGTRDSSFICSKSDVQPLGVFRVSPETEANDFAAELLMPEAMFKPKCSESLPSLNYIQSCAEEFQATLTATALRYIEFCPYRCAIILSKNNAIKWVKVTEDFGYRLESGQKLHPDCWATDFFRGESLSREMQTVLARSWLQYGRVSSMARISEQSWGFQNYGEVMTLIFLDDSFDV